MVEELGHSALGMFLLYWANSQYHNAPVEYPIMHQSHIPWCTIFNTNVHNSVKKVALWDICVMHCGICEVGLLISNALKLYVIPVIFFCIHNLHKHKALVVFSSFVDTVVLQVHGIHPYEKCKIRTCLSFTDKNMAADIVTTLRARASAAMIWTGVILGLRPANERHCYIVTASLIGWAQA